ncbi:hypothetical protein V6N12_055155 [Hibiscus sabdariffa]|uniref:Uncharacterized protein n=1 Tax=Hibiscus sabdariffa TaxID=183260 RepID=A0ABR2AMD2_9ROSI
MKAGQTEIVFANPEDNAIEKRSLALTVLLSGGVPPWTGSLIFHRLEERRRCYYLLGLAMRQTFKFLFRVESGR